MGVSFAANSSLNNISQGSAEGRVRLYLKYSSGYEYVGSVLSLSDKLIARLHKSYPLFVFCYFDNDKEIIL